MILPSVAGYSAVASYGTPFGRMGLDWWFDTPFGRVGLDSWFDNPFGRMGLDGG